MVLSSGLTRKYGKFSNGNKIFVGEVREGTVIEARTRCMMDVIESTARWSNKTHPLSNLKVLAPVDRPSKIICIGLNYRSHIREMKQATPKKPVIFTKPSSAIIGPDEKIVLPSMSSRVDYEGESAAVIGKRASHVSHGRRFIFGFTCFNDVTARDLQKIDFDWTRAKGFDTFAPVGPFISTKPPLRIMTRLNGRIVQDAPLAERVFDDAQLVEYISSIMVLEPGDLIATGTPSGISPLKDGDIVEVELDGIGCLRNQVVQSQ